MNYTLILTIAIVAVSLLGFNNQEFRNRLILFPRGMHNNPAEYYRLLTHGFLHADWGHLFFNGLALFSFGSAVERAFSFAPQPEWVFPLMFLSAIVVSAIPQFIKHRNDSFYSALGASGGVAAVIFSAIYYAPWSQILLFFIPIPAIIFGVLYLIYSAYAARKSRDNIGHDAHFWGSVYGFIFTLAVDPSHGVSFLEELAQPRF